MPSNVLNKRSLESLIHCGALDEFSDDNNRAQLLSDLEHVIEWASSRNRDRLSGQGNLFDSKEEFSNVAFSDSQLAKVDDYSLIEKLKLEKQLLGFYLSDHRTSPGASEHCRIGDSKLRGGHRADGQIRERAQSLR